MIGEGESMTETTAEWATRMDSAKERRDEAVAEELGAARARADMFEKELVEVRHDAELAHEELKTLRESRDQALRDLRETEAALVDTQSSEDHALAEATPACR